MRRRLQHLPRPVAGAILAFYRRRRFYEFLRTLIAPLLCYGVLALIATHLDRFLFLDVADRLWISGLTHGIVILTGAVSMGMFVWRQVSVSSLAYEMERMLPRTTAERLVTLDDILARGGADHVSGGAVRAAMVDQLTGETVELCERTPHAGRLARDRRLKRRTVALSLLALVWAGLFSAPGYQFPLMLQRLTFPGRNLPKPSFMRLTVTPEAPIVGRGGEVVLQAQVSGEIPRLLKRPMRWLGTDANLCLLATATGRVERLSVAGAARPMSRVQRRLFVASRNDLQESFSYRVRCGDAQTDVRFVRVVAQPRATGICVEVEPPAYTDLPPVRFEDLRDPIPVFATSRVKVRFASDQSPLKSCRLIAQRDGKTIAELKPDPATGDYLYEFEMADPVELEIALVNEMGFENVERYRMAMTLREDQPPSVRLEYPGGEITVAQGELVPMQIELSDDLGLLEGAICYQINAGRNSDAASREIPLAVEEKKLAQSISANFDLEEADAVPGDEVVLWVRARDTGRSDARSQIVRIRVVAFAGNENERRRLIALRLVAQALATIEPSPADRTVLAPTEAAYEPIANSANAQGLVLNRLAAAESLRDFLEREHFFTDSAEAAAEVRMLHGAIAALLRMPPTALPRSVESRRDALRALAESILPALLHERMARDLVLRALSLRGETLEALRGGGDAPGRKNRASSERRIDLLMEAFDGTGADLAALARMSPELLKVDDVLAFTRQISRTVRELKHSDETRRQAAGNILCEQIDGWIGLLLPPLPEWKLQRAGARAALRAQYDGLRDDIEAAMRNPGRARIAESIRWAGADARLVERSPFIGLGERLAYALPGTPQGAAALTNAAMACETRALSRMAVEGEFADRTAARAMPSERRLTAAFKALDLADAAPARDAAAERLRTLNLNDDLAPIVEAAPPPVSFGLYARLPALASAATAVPEPHDKALDDLAARTSKLSDNLAQIGQTPDGGVPSGLSAALVALESGLAGWEADAARLSYRVHLDLTYGDPRREEIVRLSAVLPALRDALDRYRVVVPPLLGRMRNRLGRGSGPENLAAMTLDMEELVRSVNSLGSAVKRAAKQLRGEMATDEESRAVREIRGYYSAAWKLAEEKNPASAAEAFFAGHPSAAAIVFEEQTPMLLDLRSRLKEAGESLRTETAAGAAFLAAMKQATRIAGDFDGLLARLPGLDRDRVVRTLVADIRKRAEGLIRPDRETGPDTAPRDRLAVDELCRRAELLETQVREMIARNAPAVPMGWRGGPSGVWDDAGRRDAEHARLRALAQFDRARRAAALGFYAVLVRRDEPGAVLPDAPLAGSLFAWRIFHSSLGGGTMIRPPPPPPPPPHDQLLRWLLKELDETRKALLGIGGQFKDPTTSWVDSAKGVFRSGNERTIEKR